MRRVRELEGESADRPSDGRGERERTSSTKDEIDRCGGARCASGLRRAAGDVRRMVGWWW